MPDTTQQQTTTARPARAPSGGPSSEAPAQSGPNDSIWIPALPSPSCHASCCRKGNEWIQFYNQVDMYPNGPCESLLPKFLPSLLGRIGGFGFPLRVAGLARWDDLPPAARDNMSRWSPVARQLWESDFDEHKDGLISAWIWRYLDYHIFWSPGAADDAAPPLPCATPAWEYARGLRRELYAVRARHANAPRTAPTAFLRSLNLTVQHQAWGRLTEHLVRDGGLGAEPFRPDQLIPHFKASLRQLLVDGAAAIPDRASDNTWEPSDEDRDADNAIGDLIKWVLDTALAMRHWLHGMPAVWGFRFSPPGHGDMHEEPWGFALDDKCMEEVDLICVPRQRPGTEEDEEKPALPPVRLVTQPMLVKTGFDRIRNLKEPHVWTRMKVLMPWTFDIRDALPHRPGHPDEEKEEEEEEEEEEACGTPPVGGGSEDGATSEAAGEEGGARETGTVRTAKAMPGTKADEQAAAEVVTPVKTGTKRKKGEGKTKAGKKAGVKQIRAK